MAKFKVGDKVRVTNTKHDCKKYLIGKEFVIKEVFDTCNNDLGCYSIGEPYLVNVPEIELVRPKFNIEDYRGKVVMHCQTHEDAKIFYKYLNTAGKKWLSGAIYGDEYDPYSFNTCDTCYNFNDGKHDHINWYISENYRILEFEDFDWSDFTMKKEFTKADLKNGDVIKYRNGLTGVVCIETGAVILDRNEYMTVDTICDDLTHLDKAYTSSYRNSDWDIVAVRRPNEPCDCRPNAFDTKQGTLVYERKEVEEMTLEEVCKALGKEIKIVKK